MSPPVCASGGHTVPGAEDQVTGASWGGALAIAKLVILPYGIDMLVTRAESRAVWVRIDAAAMLAGLVMRFLIDRGIPSMTIAPRKHLVWIPLALLSLLLVAGCGSAESRKARHMEKGQEFLAAGNFEKARLEFRDALEIFPKDSGARNENGVVEEKLGNLREAAHFYQGAIDSDKDNVRARANLGRLYAMSGAADKAIETVDPGFDKHPDDVDLLTVRAAARLQLNDVSGALTDAERAVQLAPANENAISVLAGIYKSQGQADKAQALLDDAIKKSPNTIDLRLVLAQLDSSLGKKAEVESLLLDLVRLKPDEKAHRLRLAQFYSRTDQADAAEKVLRDGVKALPEQRELKTALVDFLAARRSREIAESELTTLIAASPNDYELKLLQASFYEQGKEIAKAETVYKDVIAAAKLEGPGITARDRLAALLVQLNDIPAAEKLIAEVLARSPRDNDALILRGNLALAHSDPKSAISDLRAVLQDQPNAIGVMRSLARAHLANGEPALAEETMRHAVEASPNDAATRLDFAQLLAQLGKPDRAKPVVEELVKLQPNNMQVLDLEFKVAAATKDFVTAKAAADAMVALQPKLVLGFYYQGQLAESDKRLDEALRLYSTALELQPEAAEPLQAVTRVLVNLKRAPDALKRLDDYSTRYPKAAFALNLKGEVLVSNGRAAESIPVFKMAIERDPNWWMPYRNLAIAQSRADKNNEETIATLQSGISKASIPEPLESELATLYERDGKVDDAVQVYEAALRQNPKSDVTANNLAMLLASYKKDARSLDRAKELSRRFATSTNANFLDTYGWVLYKRGEAQAAITALQNSLTKAPDQPIFLYHLGMAQALAGQAAAARESLTRSLQSGKDFNGMDEAKATLDKLPKDAPDDTVPSKS
ncbi:MAG: tetratricopeptide repeat protein [Steroidobacteraceae bacterium]